MIPWHSPQVAALELTLRCPCRCQTCGSSAGQPRARELDRAAWLRVVGELADLGCRRVSLMGGEPRLAPGWADVARAAHGRGLIVDMISSGQGLDESAARAIRDSGIHAVTVSVDGLATTHDRQRGVPGCFTQAMRAIRAIDGVGLKAGATTQVNRENVDELAALAPILEDAGVLGWQLQMTLPIGRAGLHQHLALRRPDMAGLLHAVRRLARRSGLRPHLTDNLGYCSRDDLELRTIQGGFPRPWLGCRAGLDTVGITSDGLVKGCLALPDTCVEGDLHLTSLAEVWSDASKFAYNRGYSAAQLAGPCAACPHAAHCRGGCSATAFATFGRPGQSEHCFRLALPADQG